MKTLFSLTTTITLGISSTYGMRAIDPCDIYSKSDIQSLNYENGQFHLQTSQGQHSLSQNAIKGFEQLSPTQVEMALKEKSCYFNVDEHYNLRASFRMLGGTKDNNKIIQKSPNNEPNDIHKYVDRVLISTGIGLAAGSTMGVGTSALTGAMVGGALPDTNGKISCAVQKAELEKAEKKYERIKETEDKNAFTKAMAAGGANPNGDCNIQ